ncbi:hypothetical protein DICPUDRAFT_37192 [Dictyostelium purpureum]|uniref:Complex III subunit 9 n=1 Tax=Dictyostelium purpureum TaxID=5786 RepID=F0ZSC3_DICPU|nr:uncharacterized protein DICPUDRAFT_37192 [Dictyostelium purpureum]EGC33164.1 hypothetical protein DICPUDRAFT_37192 [Dictyostelium purpureum]|eukprot:XP_003290320.1 hypothetical protein DICPUDRAFT_37192 [Dictyostelium purpureum]
MSLPNLFYKYVARNNSTWMAAVVVGAFALDTTVNGTVNVIFDGINKDKLWKTVYAERVKKGISQ